MLQPGTFGPASLPLAVKLLAAVSLELGSAGAARTLARSGVIMLYSRRAGAERRFRAAGRMWTEGAAYSLFMEPERGTLAVGAAADLVVLSADPLTTALNAWDKDLAVDLTVVGGTVAYTRPDSVPGRAGPAP